MLGVGGAAAVARDQDLASGAECAGDGVDDGRDGRDEVTILGRARQRGARFAEIIDDTFLRRV